MFKKILSLSVIVSFFLTSLGSLPQAHADSVLGLPTPGTMINLTPAYVPVIVKGLRVHPENPILFDFLVDSGNSGLSASDPQLKAESEKLIKYFLASLTIPEDNLWVNLSPYEKDRIIPDQLGQTEMGRDMLAEDYILKQLTASLIYPEKNLGREFWNKVYAKTQEQFGTSEIPVNTFNKVWIVADKAKVYVHDNTAFVVASHLKVMLEEDYLSLQKHSGINNVIPAKAGIQNTTHSVASQIIKEIVLPQLEQEVNTGKNFANLRQIFHSMILAAWYKKNLKEALLNQVYSNKSKISNLVIPAQAGIHKMDANFIYQQYLKAYKKGVFNYIKEDIQNGQTIPRKYFSGGLKINAEEIETDTRNFDDDDVKKFPATFSLSEPTYWVTAGTPMAQTVKSPVAVTTSFTQVLTLANGSTSSQVVGSLIAHGLSVSMTTNPQVIIVAGHSMNITKSQEFEQAATQELASWGIPENMDPEDDAMIAELMQILTSPRVLSSAAHTAGIAALAIGIVNSMKDYRNGKNARTLEEKLKYYKKFRNDLWHIGGVVTIIASGIALGEFHDPRLDTSNILFNLIEIITGTKIGGGIRGYERMGDQLIAATENAIKNGTGIEDEELIKVENDVGNPKRNFFFNKTDWPVFFTIAALATLKPFNQDIPGYHQWLEQQHLALRLASNLIPVGIGGGIGAALAHFFDKYTPETGTLLSVRQKELVDYMIKNRTLKDEKGVNSFGILYGLIRRGAINKEKLEILYDIVGIRQGDITDPGLPKLLATILVKLGDEGDNLSRIYFGDHDVEDYLAKARTEQVRVTQSVTESTINEYLDDEQYPFNIRVVVGEGETLTAKWVDGRKVIVLGNQYKPSPKQIAELVQQTYHLLGGGPELQELSDRLREDFQADGIEFNDVAMTVANLIDSRTVDGLIKSLMVTQTAEVRRIKIRGNVVPEVNSTVLGSLSKYSSTQPPSEQISFWVGNSTLIKTDAVKLKEMIFDLKKLRNGEGLRYVLEIMCQLAQWQIVSDIRSSFKKRLATKLVQMILDPSLTEEQRREAQRTLSYLENSSHALSNKDVPTLDAVGVSKIAYKNAVERLASFQSAGEKFFVSRTSNHREQARSSEVSARDQVLERAQILAAASGEKVSLPRGLRARPAATKRQEARYELDERGQVKRIRVKVGYKYQDVPLLDWVDPNMPPTQVVIFTLASRNISVNPNSIHRDEAMNGTIPSDAKINITDSAGKSLGEFSVVDYSSALDLVEQAVNSFQIVSAGNREEMATALYPNMLRLGDATTPDVLKTIIRILFGNSNIQFFTTEHNFGIQYNNLSSGLRTMGKLAAELREQVKQYRQDFAQTAKTDVAMNGVVKVLVLGTLALAALVPAVRQTIQPADGGIDLNSKNMKMDVDGQTINMRFDPRLIAQFRRGDFSGVRPVIFKITPVFNIMSLMGFKVPV